MSHYVIAGSGCSGGDCPTVHGVPTEQEDVFVQGYVVTDATLLAELGLPAGETVVRVPRTLLVEAGRKIEDERPQPGRGAA